jgi:hypothetical protein
MFNVKEIKYYTLNIEMSCNEQLKMLCFVQDETFEVILLVILVLSGTTDGTLLPSKSLSVQDIHVVR